MSEELNDKQLKEKIADLYDEEDERIEIIVEGDWVSDYKYEIREDIVKYDGKFYSINLSRSGSYFTDYDYLEPEVYQVTPREELVKKIFWDVVK